MKKRNILRAEMNMKVKIFRVSASSMMVVGLFSLPVQSAVLMPPQGDDLFGWEDKNSYKASGNEIFDGIEAEITPTISGSQFFINIENGASIQINGDSKISSVSDGHKDDQDEENGEPGTYVFRVSGSGSSLKLNGNVDIITEHDLSPEDQLTTIGANLFYADQGGIIDVGLEGTTTRAWTIAAKPDLITAKKGGCVNIKSINNQLVGNIDFMEMPDLNGMTIVPHTSSTVKGAFSGEDSYWFGDEQTWQDMSLQNIAISVKNSEMAGQFLTQIESEIKEYLNKAHNELSLSFANGAQWSYIGSSDVIQVTEDILNMSVTVSVTPVQKRISNIELLDGGIVNLFDDDLKNKWKEINPKSRPERV